MKSDQKEYPAKRLGKLPAHSINAALGIDLAAGEIWLSSAAHSHIALDHPEDYRLYFRYLEAAILKPTYIGQAAKHSNGFEIVYQVPAQSIHILIAIAITRNAYGTYNVKSMYSIKDKTVINRQNSKRLFRVN